MFYAKIQEGNWTLDVSKMCDLQDAQNCSKNSVP